MPRRTILVADPDEGSRTICARILRHAGYRTLEAADGADLLRKVLAHRPAAVVMELRLPDMDGYTAITRLRGRARTARIPVVVITVREAAAGWERARGLGRHDHLLEPCAPRWLLAAVQRALIASEPRGGTHPSECRGRTPVP